MLRNKHFNIEKRPYYYTNGIEALAVQPVELNDRVIPSLNSVIAENLIKLGTLSENTEYLKQADSMLRQMKENITQKSYSYANCYNQALLLTYPLNEIAISGNSFLDRLRVINEKHLPNVILMGGLTSTLPLTQGKFDSNSTRIFVCQKRLVNSQYPMFQKL